MKKPYDFSKGRRGAVIPQTGKTRITIYIDDAIVARFKAQSENTGKGYQTLINEALKSYLGLTEKALTPELVRKIVREELAAHNCAETARSDDFARRSDRVGAQVGAQRRLLCVRQLRFHPEVRVIAADCHGHPAVGLELQELHRR
jgi:Arc/MetJ family transcription regulator